MGLIKNSILLELSEANARVPKLESQDGSYITNSAIEMGETENIKADHRDTVLYNSAATLHHHTHSHCHSHHSHHSYHRQIHQVEDNYSHSSYYSGLSVNAGDGQGYDYSPYEPSSSTSSFSTYSPSQTYAPSSSSYATYTTSIARDNRKAKPYDPVRDL
ncbi:hypothetical protein DID88_002840 [Monilinia fructigena]|uniref:Uncharacterized protein n=1 Tax=Monilinia fructigena TaxID=38457 RepID=A0A395INA0_9HELO|nr:hypothetical protein DID88_002840 [Monilinia fructigena]